MLSRAQWPQYNGRDHYASSRLLFSLQADYLGRRVQDQVAGEIRGPNRHLSVACVATLVRTPLGLHMEDESADAYSCASCARFIMLPNAPWTSAGRRLATRVAEAGAHTPAIREEAAAAARPGVFVAACWLRQQRPSALRASWGHNPDLGRATC